MKVISSSDLNKNLSALVEAIQEGKIFIYPTDTIYGIGCDATNAKAVKKIREIKQRDVKPFSVVAPSKSWIKENCVIPEFGKKWLSKLPGPYTLILKLKNKQAIAEEMNASADTLGVRIPHHEFSDLVTKSKVPFITTSVNLAGQPPAQSIDQIPKEILQAADIIIDEGPKAGHPSTLVDLTGDTEKVLNR